MTDIMNKDLILRERLALQRTTLANQSTFLSFLRTSMYFLVAGISVDKLLATSIANFFEYVFFIISALVLVIGIANYFIQKRKIAKSEIHIGNYQREYGDTNERA